MLKTITLHIIQALLLTLLISGCVQNTTKYKEGQVWSYNTREHEKESKIYISKIDYDDELGAIYHIYIDNLKIKNPYIDTEYQDILPHLPASEKTLDDSLLTKVSDTFDKSISIDEGYRQWKKAFDENNAGIFTIPIHEIIDSVEEIISSESSIPIKN